MLSDAHLQLPGAEESRRRWEVELLRRATVVTPAASSELRARGLCRIEALLAPHELLALRESVCHCVHGAAAPR